MANRTLFSNKSNKSTPVTNTYNEAGGAAYALSDEAALAQYAVTGCLNGTYYATAEDQLAKIKEMAAKVSTEFLAKLAIYAREQGLMKDVPALLLAILASRNTELAKRVFPRVADDAKMVKNFVQIIRSGATGRRSMGSALKRMVQNWLESRTEEQLFKAVVGTDPSLADIIKMVHPKPATKARANFYRYLIGKELTPAQFRTLPKNVQAYEKFKIVLGDEVPEVPFMLLTNLNLSPAQYKQVAENMSWSALRQNLNALSKHGIFDDAVMTKAIVAKISDPELVRKAKALPFQLFSSYHATQGNTKIPAAVSNAIQDAMEVSLSNVPELSGKTYVAVDISGSMGSPATGNRGSATSTVTCLDAAAVMGSALLRRNPNDVEIIPFSDDVVLNSGQRMYDYRLNKYSVVSGARVVFNGRDSVMTNVQKLRALPSGGTSCSSVLTYLNAQNVKGVTSVIYVSDNMSWADSAPRPYGGGQSEMMRQWNIFKARNPKAKLVCIDIQPYGSSQVVDRPDILNVGGFSDSVFTVVDMFLRNELTPEHFAGKIKEVEI